MTWSEVKDDKDGVYQEIHISNFVEYDNKSSDTSVLKCCKEADIWMQLIDASPIIAYSRLTCKSCGKIGEETDWSHEMAVALWNVSLWNPIFRGRKPLKLADRFEKLGIDQITAPIPISKELLFLIDKIPRALRDLVYESEENRVARYWKEETDAQQDQTNNRNH